MTHGLPTIEVLGVPVACLDRSTALVAIEELYDAPGAALVVYANAHALNLACGDPGYREVLGSADIVLNDGSGLALAARIQGRRFPANLNGSDLNPEIAGLAARRGWPLFLLGAKPGVAEEAGRRLQQRYPGLALAGARHGYLEPGDDERVVEEIASSGAGVVMVAMGNPAQEFWLTEHLADTGARLGVGVGAFLDFTAGTVPRAPAWMNRWGIEWVWRLGQEPARMWRRYLVGNPLFLYRVLRARFTKTAR